MEDALARPWQEVPDVVLVDIGLPGMSGLEGLPVLRERYPDAALVMLTVYEIVRVLPEERKGEGFEIEISTSQQSFLESPTDSCGLPSWSSVQLAV
jgi:CheY-like chemotaxis protein